LRTLGFSVTNAIFADNAWYFRNALVRANYTNLQKGVYETTEYLEIFLRNLLLNEKERLFDKFGNDKVFGRNAVVELLGIQNSSASKLISKLVKAEIIGPVSGYGKGKYNFKKDYLH
jgi:hypothetical protein